MNTTGKTFKKQAIDYLCRLQKTYKTAIDSGEATPELSYRPVLDKFFSELPNTLGVQNVEAIFEPRKQVKSGRPDWRFHDKKSMAILGYIEAKSFDPTLKMNLQNFKAQVDKYLELGHKVVLTDGIDFLFFTPEGGSKRSFLTEKPLPKEKLWSDLEVNSNLLNEWMDFFESPAARLVSDAELMADMAKRAKAISEDVLSLVRLEPDSGVDEEENVTIQALHGLKELLESGHDPDLCDDRKFSDMVAQVLVFGLLYAHRHLAEKKSDALELYDKLHFFWTETIRADGANRLRPFRALAETLASGRKELGLLRTWYSDCILYLSYVRFRDESEVSPNYHAMYEQFLIIYDPINRMDFGAYATPKILASYMVAFCDWIAKIKFRRDSLYVSGNKIIDPCCGTGTFLEETLRAIASRKNKKLELPILAGFEILAAPYALAQYRLTLLDFEGLKDAKSVHIVMCNTLADCIVDSTVPTPPTTGPEEAKQLFHLERKEAVHLSKPPITAVIGNPPSSDAGLHINPKTHGRILELIENFRPPEVERSSRQNIQKQLQNDFVKFVRWACHKLPIKEPGIMAFIVPSSFLKHNSYAYARKWLVENFKWIWIVEFDCDGRTGTPTSNVFPTLQGRTIIFCAREASTATEKIIKYSSVLSLNKSEKIDFFEEELRKLTNNKDFNEDKLFKRIEISEPYCKFQPTVQYNKTLYERFWKLCPEKSEGQEEKIIFLRHCSGLKLGITSALVHSDPKILFKRTCDLASPSMNYERLKGKWFQGLKKPPRKESLTSSVREKIGEYLTADRVKKQIFKYDFRPFNQMYAFLPLEILQKLASTGGGGTRYRPEVLAAFSKKGNFGISIAPAPEDIGETLHRFSSFSWNIPDNDLCSRGNAHVFCLYFPEYKKTDKWDDRPKLNISSELLKSLGAKKENDEKLAGELIFYIYAFLSSNKYLDMFEGVLYQTAGQWPRIPITNDMEALKRLSGLGRKLAECENSSVEIDIGAKLLNNFKIFQNREIKIKKFLVDDSKGSLTLFAMDDEEYMFPGLDRNVLSCKIAGYKVVEEWLKWRSWPYLRRAFRWEDAQAFVRLIAGIQCQFELIEKIDKEVHMILSKPSKLL